MKILKNDTSHAVKVRKIVDNPLIFRYAVALSLILKLGKNSVMKNFRYDIIKVHTLNNSCNSLINKMVEYLRVAS